MIVTRSGSHAIVADPDRDRLLSVDLATRIVTAEVVLTAGDQPGRLVEDGAGRIHVALRGGGAILTINAVGETLDRRYACGEPRGITWDQTTDLLHVACATGELVSFSAVGGEPVRSIRLERDLRDVMVQGQNLVVTKFRSAEILTVDAGGAIVSRITPPKVQRFDFGGPFPSDSSGGGTSPGGGGVIDANAAVAWKTVQLPDGRIVVSHQRQLMRKLGTGSAMKEEGGGEGGYGTPCGGGPAESAVTVIPAPGSLNPAPIAVMPISQGALPVDIAISKNGDKIAVVTAGNRNVRVQQTSFALSSRDQNDGCRPPDPPDDPEDMDDDTDEDSDEDVDEGGAPTSAAFTPTGDLIVYYPEKPMLEILRGGQQTFAPEVIALPGLPGIDAGRSVFHKQTSIGLACASCHPEGREDGLTWDFVEFGKRRTQNLAGDILERAPYHWTGDMNSLPTLMDDVFAERMAGGALSERQKRSLGPWLDRLPAPAAQWSEPTAIERGKDLFSSTGCASCHNGPQLTNNLLVDVGTGGMFKVPSLVGIGARAPFMHDGCAKTLTDRFTTCGNSPLHGATQNLTPAEIGDLVQYLESL